MNDMNARGMFGDDRVNDNRKSLLEVCLEWNLIVSNTFWNMWMWMCVYCLYMY